MVRTRFCELLEIDVPIVQAAIWPAASPELVAAVSEAGAIGSLAALFGSAETVSEEIDRVRELTERPFIVNHVVPQLDDDAVEATLAARPAAVSFALGDPGDLIERVHAAGAIAIHQVHTVDQAREAAALGVDAIIAQGGEAGGQGMEPGVGTMALVPEVVDAVGPIPVLAAGGIGDGRGLAAALALGAEGANVGTRFLASEEAAAAEDWQEQIVAAGSRDAVRFEVWRELFPRAEAAYDVVPRVLATAFVSRWHGRPEETRAEAEQVRTEIIRAVATRSPGDVVPFTGQSAGLVREVLPAGEIVRQMAAQAETSLRR